MDIGQMFIDILIYVMWGSMSGSAFWRSSGLWIKRVYSALDKHVNVSSQRSRSFTISKLSICKKWLNKKSRNEFLLGFEFVEDS